MYVYIYILQAGVVLGFLKEKEDDVIHLIARFNYY